MNKQWHLTVEWGRVGRSSIYDNVEELIAEIRKQLDDAILIKIEVSTGEEDEE